MGNPSKTISRQRSRWVGVALLSLLAVLLLVSDRGAQWGLQLRHYMTSHSGFFGQGVHLRIEGMPSMPLFVDPSDRVVSRSMERDGFWERTETEWFLRSLRPGDVVVDVGANIGYYTLLAAQKVGESGKVFAFEPDPSNFSLLQDNVKLNGFSNVVLERKAVSDAPGVLRLYTSESNTGDHRIFNPEGEERSFEEVPAVTLDGYFEGREESVDFVKIDTQGAEGKILAGMPRLVGRSPDLVIAVEFSPEHLAGIGSEARDVTGPLVSWQMDLFELGPGGRYLVPVRPVEAEDLLRRFPREGFGFTNILAVRQRPELIRELAGSLRPGAGTRVGSGDVR